MRMLVKPNRVPKALLMYALYLGTSSASIAANNSEISTPSLFKLSLEELLQVKVVTPSKTPQTLQDTPGIVSVLTAREIALYGGRDIGEVLSRVLGFSEYAALNNGRNMVTIRDDQPTPNNNHVLFLLNGTPLNRESYTGGLWNEAILTSIPLQSIKLVEVTRGPGSVLYGTNAFAGVVNIITYSAGERGNTLEAGYGSFNHRQVNGFVSGNTAGWDWTSAMRWTETDGWPFEMNESDGDTFSGDAWSLSPGVLATASKGGLSINGYWGKSSQWTTRGNASEIVGAETVNEKSFLALAYEKTTESGWTLSSHLSHVRGRTDHDVVSAPPQDFLTIKYLTDDSRIELQAKNTFSNNAEIVFGGTLDYFRGSTPLPTQIVPDWNEQLVGFYGQYELPIGSHKYIAGFQYNKASNSDSLVPRLGYVFRFNDNLGLKLLYGQAFRSPYIVERKLNISIPNLSITGDENLKPETVTTYDAQLNYKNGRFESALTLFKNVQMDLIIRRPVGPGTLRFENHGELTIQGLEFESKYASKNSYISLSYSHQENKNGDGLVDFTLQPDHRLKLGLGLSTSEWDVGLFNVYSSAYKDNIIVDPSRQIVNDEPSGFNRLSLNIRYQPRSIKDWEMEVFVDNMLDETLYLPGQQGDALSGINTRPALSERFIMLTIRKNFRD